MAGDWSVNAGRLWAVGVTTTIIAILAAIVVWIIGEALFDEPLLVADQDGDLVEMSVGPIIMITAIAGLLATAVLHLLLAFVPNGQAYFFTIGTLALLASFLLVIPLDITTANKLWLIVMHVTVYAFIVPGLAGAVPRVAVRKPETPQAPA